MLGSMDAFDCSRCVVLCCVVLAVNEMMGTVNLFDRSRVVVVVFLRGEYEYAYSWGRPKWNIISYFRGYSMIFHL